MFDTKKEGGKKHGVLKQNIFIYSMEIQVPNTDHFDLVNIQSIKVLAL